tara:strand:- start:8045 stop:8293 length:249 start_codon:yes stop_codon:yes gene_type:complete
MGFSLFMLCVVDYYKTDWHEIDINFIPNGYTLYKYFESHYKNIEDIWINKNGKDYNLKNIRNIEDYIEKNPNRACIYLYLES